MYIIEGHLNEVMDNTFQFFQGGTMVQLQATLRQRYGIYHTGSVMTQVSGFHLIRTKDPSHTARVLLAHTLRVAVGKAFGKRDAVEWMTDRTSKKIDFSVAQEEFKPEKRLDTHTASRLCKYMIYALPGLGDKPVERVVEHYPTIAAVYNMAREINGVDDRNPLGYTATSARAAAGAAGAAGASSQRNSGQNLEAAYRNTRLDDLMRTLVPPDSAKFGPGSRSVTKEKIGRICDFFTSYF